MADKALFEQPLQENPDYQHSYDTHRFAFGKAGAPTLNVTLSAFKTWLRNTLTGWLESSQNLADLPNKATSRNNLSVYSKAETYSQGGVDFLIQGINGKLGGLTIALVCKVDEDGTIHKYGGTLSATCSRDGNLTYTITHNFGNTNYLIIPTRKIEQYFHGMAWNTNDFTIAFNDQSLNKYAQEFYFIMYLLS